MLSSRFSITRCERSDGAGFEKDIRLGTKLHIGSGGHA